MFSKTANGFSSISVVIQISNQIFHYSRCVTPNSVTIFCRQFCVIVSGQSSCFFRRNVATVASHWQHCVQFDCQRFEPQTSRFRGERVTARPTGKLWRHTGLNVFTFDDFRPTKLQSRNRVSPNSRCIKPSSTVTDITFKFQLYSPVAFGLSAYRGLLGLIEFKL